MKYFLLMVLLTSAQNAFASPAVAYICAGTDSVSKQAVAFDLLFSDYGAGEGYTNESVTVTRVGYEVLAKPVVFQMHGATKQNNCKAIDGDEHFMFGGFDMNATKNGDVAPYQVNFKSACGEGLKFDVKGYCFFQ